MSRVIPIVERRNFIDRQKAAESNYQLRKAAEETRKPLHPYDEARQELSPFHLAEHILKDQGLLHIHPVGKGEYAQFIDGKYATPSLKVETANRVLKKLKLRPIELRRV